MPLDDHPLDPDCQNICVKRQAVALSAADAHDAANGIHRVMLDGSAPKRQAITSAAGLDAQPHLPEPPEAWPV